MDKSDYRILKAGIKTTTPVSGAKVATPTNSGTTTPVSGATKVVPPTKTGGEASSSGSAHGTKKAAIKTTTPVSVSGTNVAAPHKADLAKSSFFQKNELKE